MSLLSFGYQYFLNWFLTFTLRHVTMYFRFGTWTLLGFIFMSMGFLLRKDCSP